MLSNPMTRSELIERLARAITAREGFFVAEPQAETRALKSPTRSQRNANPGNVREWHDAKGQDYPQAGGYVMENFPKSIENRSGEPCRQLSLER